MYIKAETTEVINQSLKLITNVNEPVIVESPVSGGSINSCYKLRAGKQCFFLKINDSRKYPEMFLKEAEGLKTIRSTNAINVPAVIAQGTAGIEQYLILNWVEEKTGSRQAWEKLGENLAKMHQVSSHSFGLGYGNYMGSLGQSNKRHKSWASFFINERLIPQVQMATKKHLLDSTLTDKFNLLYDMLPELFSEEAPSLIHGDLWSGNYIITEGGEPVLIDPAISFGHREFDIAMTTLFGGFNQSFYDSYNNAFPLQKGWEKRLPLWNLYPLLIHLNLFGSSYLSPIKSSLAKYIHVR